MLEPRPCPPRHPISEFGVWANVHGSWASFHHPDDPPNATWSRNRDQILRAEELGYESTLVAQHMVNPHGDEYGQLEAWSASAALAALTDRIEIVTATGAIGTNGGTAAGPVGSYDTVTGRSREFQELGVELLMLQFQPFEAEMRRFAEQVIPRVRALEPSAASA